MKIISWNINSLRLRINNLSQLINKENPDIVCLQETKVSNDNFPMPSLKKLPYPHIYFDGEKSYNGVAIISKIPLKNIKTLKLVNNDCRHISGTLPDGSEIHNFYVPAGGDIPNPKENPKFDHKLKFVEAMASWFSKNKKSKDKIIIVGDLNIAPMENDVWSHKQLLDVVSHTPAETSRMKKLKDTLGWVDTSREFCPAEEKLYSWWSYRNRDWRKSNRGRRLDHIWITPTLKKCLTNSYIMKDARDWSLPSDHVPVITELKL